MRMLLATIVGLIASAAFAVVVQVLIAQSTEIGDFRARISSVLHRQFDFADKLAPVAEAEVRGQDTPGAQSSGLGSIRISDMTAADLETMIRQSTQTELEQLHRTLTREADRRDKAGFWTDVKLNSLFLFLGFAVPTFLTRRRS